MSFLTSFEMTISQLGVWEEVSSDLDCIKLLRDKLL